MKTNHKRGFKDTKAPRAVFSRYIVFGQCVKLELSGRSVAASVTCGDHTNGKRGIAKDRRGAKKYIHSRSRFHEKAALQKMVSSVETFEPETIES
jgi:hypothetical protein